MGRWEDELVTARASTALTHSLHLSVWLREGQLCAAFESRLPPLEDGYAYRAEWVYRGASLIDHDSLEGALGAALADPPEGWLALLPEGAVWSETATSLTAELAEGLRREIDRTVDATITEDPPAG